MQTNSYPTTRIDMAVSSLLQSVQFFYRVRTHGDSRWNLPLTKQKHNYTYINSTHLFQLIDIHINIGLYTQRRIQPYLCWYNLAFLPYDLESLCFYLLTDWPAKHKLKTCTVYMYPCRCCDKLAIACSCTCGVEVPNPCDISRFDISHSFRLALVNKLVPFEWFFTRLEITITIIIVRIIPREYYGVVHWLAFKNFHITLFK